MQRTAPLGPSAHPSRSARLQLDVSHLATEIGPRNIHHYPSLRRAAQHIEASLSDAGYVATRQTFAVGDKSFDNIIAEKRAIQHARRSLSLGLITTPTRILPARTTMVLGLPRCWN